MRKSVMLVLFFLLVLCAAPVALGLENNEILVIYNENFKGSKTLADYYVAKRKIPAKHVLAIKTPLTERISRHVYLKTIQGPIKSWIRKNSNYEKIKCILLMRSVPLAVNRITDEKTFKPYDKTKRAVKKVEKQKKILVDEQKNLELQGKQDKAKTAEINGRIKILKTKIAEINTKLVSLKINQKRARKAFERVTKATGASVDSELAVMFFEKNRLTGWLPNFLNYRISKMSRKAAHMKTFMVCRLDGANDSLVKRIIDDSIETQKVGLKGIAYFDARGLQILPKKRITAYAAYDELIRRAARMVEKTGMKTVLDNKSTLFEKGACPDAALYCGWYKLAHYVPAFKWVRGSVGFHIASSEATSLRNPGSKVWCKRMIEEGISATFGPVGEPYLNSFPNPSHFYAFLLTGKYTVAEAFWYTKPMNSWMLTLITDPLYKPFEKNPKMTVTQLKENLK